MDSPSSDGVPFFESSEHGGSSSDDVSMDDAQLNSNFPGLDLEGAMDIDVSKRPASAPNVILPNRLPNLSSILETERKRKKGSRKIKKAEYDEIIKNLQEYGERHGFLDNYLELIWNLVTCQTSLNCAQRRSLIFLMLPDQQVGHQIINKILYGLKEAKEYKPTVLTAVYQLLNLYFENRLDDDNEIISTNTINCILTARTENFIIPWKTRLIRNIATPEVLTSVSINALKNLLKTKDIKKTQRDDIYATLGLCRHMRPDLFSDDDLPPWKMRVLNFPADVSRRFYNAKVRIQNEGRTRQHPLKDRIFSEFLPDCNGFSARKTILSEMLACLDSDESTASLAMNPVLLHVFEEWLKPILNYRFHYFSGFHSGEDQVRYNFMLLKIAQITKVRQEGLKVVNEWLVNFLCNWDFWIFDDIIISLLAFIRPEDILRNGEMVREKLLTQFRHSPRARVTIWKTLENWFFGWTEAVPMEEGEGDDSSLAIFSNVEARQWLLKLMNQCVEATIFTMNDSDKEAKNVRILFSNFIYNLPADQNQIDFQKEETSGAIGALKSKLLELEQLSENIPALELD